MKNVLYLLIGIVFGIVMTKSEAISWLRIYEMFRFGSFHMYGIIGSAVGLGIVWVQLIHKMKIKDIQGKAITFFDKRRGYKNYLIGGSIFGLGWAMTGACPGPMFTLVGSGYPVMLVVILSATLGTFTYGLLRNKLPH